MTDLARFTVEIDDDARNDLRTIATYIAAHQSPAIADRYLAKMLDRIEGLETMPLRGSVPKELASNKGRGIRQLVNGPHRIIYSVRGSRVIVVLVADGRRDLQTLFEARLLDWGG